VKPERVDERLARYPLLDALRDRRSMRFGIEYLGANRLISKALRLLGRDQPVEYPLGLERGGEILLKPYFRSVGDRTPAYGPLARSGGADINRNNVAWVLRAR
jgi:hypothetical protein